MLSLYLAETGGVHVCNKFIATIGVRTVSASVFSNKFMKTAKCLNLSIWWILSNTGYARHDKLYRFLKLLNKPWLHLKSEFASSTARDFNHHDFAFNPSSRISLNSRWSCFSISLYHISISILWFLTFWRFFQFYFCFNPTPNLAFVNSKILNGFDYSIFCIAKWQLSIMFCDTTFKFPVLTFSRCRRTSCSLHC